MHWRVAADESGGRLGWRRRWWRDGGAGAELGSVGNASSIEAPQERNSSTKKGRVKSWSANARWKPDDIGSSRREPTPAIGRRPQCGRMCPEGPARVWVSELSSKRAPTSPNNPRSKNAIPAVPGRRILSVSLVQSWYLSTRTIASGFSSNESKGPAKFAGPRWNAARTAAAQFLATSGFGASGAQIRKLMRPQTSRPHTAFWHSTVSSNQSWTATGPKS